MGRSFSDSRTSTVFSFYAQDEIHLRQDLILNLGLRYDHYSLFGGTTNPRAALIYNPWEKTTFKFLYGQSFRAPNLFELFYNAPGNEANPFLRPETVKTMELVWEQYFHNHFRITASGFYYPIRRLINQQVDPANGNVLFANAGSLDLRGLDFALSRSLPGGLEGTVSYSWQDPTNTSTRMAVTNAPKHLVQASRASLPLTFTTLSIMAFGMWLPYSPVASSLGFTQLPLMYWPILDADTARLPGPYANDQSLAAAEEMDLNADSERYSLAHFEVRVTRCFWPRSSRCAPKRRNRSGSRYAVTRTSE
jgi:hypothetical protein